MLSQTLPTAGPELCNIVEHWINQRTFGRVRSLRVERSEQGIVLHGYFGSYYAKQLAIQAALEVLGSQNCDAIPEVRTDIEVIKS